MDTKHLGMKALWVSQSFQGFGTLLKHPIKKIYMCYFEVLYEMNHSPNLVLEGSSYSQAGVQATDG